MRSARILLGCLLLVVLGCANGAEVRQQKNPRIGVWTPDEAVVHMKRLPDYRCEGDGGIVMAWIDHSVEWKYFPAYPGAPGVIPVEIPHGRHTHLVFDRETKRLKREWVYQWPQRGSD
jgi:hypothetical protein